MKILAISDWHGNLNKYNLSIYPDIETLVIAGDMFDRINLKQFERWLSKLPFKNILVTAGNHDFPISGNWKPKLNNVHNLTLSPITIDNKVFTGFSWCACFNAPVLSRVWVNMTCDRKILKQKVTEIPKGDILVSHSPPLDCLDEVNEFKLGVPNLLGHCLNLNYSNIICGHIHEHGGETKRVGNITIDNVAMGIKIIEV